MRLIASSDGATQTLLAIGGIRARRTLADDNPSLDTRRRQLVRLRSDEPPIEPTIEPGTPWRIARNSGIRQTSELGETSSFAWDSSADLPGGGTVSLRAVAADERVGAFAPVPAPLELLSGFLPSDDEDPLQLAPECTVPRDVLVTDLDGDEFPDVVTSDNRLSVFRGTRFGFQPPESLLPAADCFSGNSGVPYLPAYLDAADLDGDGDQDVVVGCRDEGFPSPNSSQNGIVVCRLDPGPVHEAGSPFLLETNGERVTDLELADIDRDGRTDIVAALSSRLVVYYGTDQTISGFEAAVTIREARVDASEPGLDRYEFRTVTVGDADLDGWLDIGTGEIAISAAAEEGGFVAVHCQASARSFPVSHTTFLPNGSVDEPRDVLLSDVNLDGSMDLVVANSDFVTIAVHEQVETTGDCPVFSSQPLVLFDTEETEPPVALQIADVDGNGWPDIVSANYDGDFSPRGNITTYFQQADGFEPAPQKLQPEGRGPGALVCDDITGNGRPDLVVSFDPTPLTTFRPTVYYDVGVGRFELEPNSPFGGATLVRFPKFITAGDFDGDGDADLVTANRGTGGANEMVGGGLALYRQEAVGSFQLDFDFLQASTYFGDPSEAQNAGEVFGCPQSIEAVDFNADGLLDIAVADPEYDQLVLVPQIDGQGLTMGDHLVLGGTGITNSAYVVRTADFDGDGLSDLLSGNLGPLTGTTGCNLGDEGAQGDFTLFLNDPSTGFVNVAPAQTIGGFGSTPFPSTIGVGDIDQDGWLDVAVGGVDVCRCGDNFSTIPGTQDAAPAGGFPGVLYLNSGMGGANTFVDAPRLLPGQESFYARVIEVADLDADGNLDLAIGSVPTDDDANGVVRVLFGQAPVGAGAPAFDGPVNLFGVGGNPVGGFEVAALDHDLDGDLDLVAGGVTENSLRLCTQTSNRRFSIEPLLSELDNPLLGDIVVADLNGDSLVDVGIARLTVTTSDVKLFFNRD